MSDTHSLHNVLERLRDEWPGRCLGAAFTTYTFDPRFFEDTLLATVLELRADPQEDLARFLEEARAGVIQTPVVVLADGSVRGPGRRIPYDLLEIDRRVFHPKVSLLLFEHVARLSVGSGNLTESGYGGNSEIFLVRDLAYEDAADRQTLAAVTRFFAESAALARNRGTQVAEFLQQAKRLCPELSHEEEEDDASQWFVHTAVGEPLLDQVLRRLPSNASIVRIGMLAPFYEEDGTLADTGVLNRLLDEAHKRGKLPAVDIGLSWEGNPNSGNGKPPPFEERLNKLWGGVRAMGERRLAYFVPTKVTQTRVIAEGGGEFKRSVDDVQFFPVEEVRAFGPPGLLSEVNELVPDCTYWVFPETRVEDGRFVSRPLHAKVLLIHVREGRTNTTFLLIGSANLSRRALLQETSRANVEAGILMRFEDRLHLTDLAPELVFCPSEQLVFVEREKKTAPTNWARLVESAQYAADKQTLEITWSATLKAPVPVRLVYEQAPELVLHDGPVPESLRTFVGSFVLSLSNAELALVVGEDRFAVPIQVTELAMLPVNPEAITFHLEELLLRYTGRWGPEKLRAQRSGGAARNQISEAVAWFGERGFQPSDVFKAWYGLSREMADPLLTLRGLRVLIQGPGGGEALWKNTFRAAAEGKLAKEEVFFYGLELIRHLNELQWPEDGLRAEREALRAAFVGLVREDVKSLSPTPAELPAFPVLTAFYGVTAHEPAK